MQKPYLVTITARYALAAENDLQAARLALMDTASAAKNQMGSDSPLHGELYITIEEDECDEAIEAGTIPE